MIKTIKKAKFLLLSLLIGLGVFVFINKTFATTLSRACSVSINNPSNYQVVNPNQNLTISYTISCSSDRRIRANIYFTSTGDPYTQYNPSNHCEWTYQSAGSRTYSVVYPSAGLLRAKQIEGSTAHFYVDVNEYARDDNTPPCSPENNAFYAFQDLRWVRFEEPQPRYACNTSTWQCYQSSTGPYTSLSDCQANCQPPSPCRINSFSGPSSISYGNSATLNWSTSNCNSCTASASPSNSYWSGSQSVNGSKTIYNLTQTTNFNLSCSGTYGSDSKSITINVSEPSLCRITSFYANPGSLTGGGNSTLYWATSNCVSCEASSQPSFSGWYGEVNTAGSKSVYLTQTTSFTLCCQGQGSNNYDTKTITVNVNPLPNLNVSCSASPNPSQVGQTVTFTANVSGGISPYSYYWSGAVSGSSSSVSKSFNSAGTYTAYLTVTDSASQSKSTFCSVQVQEQPRQISLNANPLIVNYNGSTVLSWSASGYNSCQGYAEPRNSQWDTSVSFSGNKTITNLTQTTTFYLRCFYNSTSYDIRSVTVTVTQQQIRYACNTSTWQCYQSSTGPYTSLSDCQANCQQPLNCQITNFSANPNPTSLNGNTVLNWSSSNCNYCTATASPANSYWSSNKEANGSTIIYNLTQATTFYLTCYGQNNTDSRNITVNLTSSNPLSVSCWASPNPGQINQTITFYSSVSGGSGIYYYNWSGDASGNSSYSYRSFSNSGTYWAYLAVNDSQGRTGSASCSVYIEAPSTNYPTLDFWADKYSLILGESTYLRWTSSNTNYCVASNGWNGNKSTNGYELTNPSNQTTYTLTCYGPGGSVSKSLTIYVNAEKNLSITKLGRNLTNGDRTYEKTLRLANGETAEFYIAVSAINTDLTNVVVKDILPFGFTYVNGTTKVNGVLQPDTITTSGLSLGNISKGTTKYITFQAIGSAVGSYLTVTNTAEATANNQAKVTDSATIVFGVVLGAATIKTGPADSLVFLLLLSLGISVSVWYYFTYHPKGKLIYARIENKIKEYRLNKVKTRILKNEK
ncbi:MAG: PKD domain-containing protein [Minisyncoccia bacterium]